MIYLTCPRCKEVNPEFVVRPVCSYCQYVHFSSIPCRDGYVELSAPFSFATASLKECFNVRGVCKNDQCQKQGMECPVALCFFCKSRKCCSLASSNTNSDRSVLMILRPTDRSEDMKVQLNKLYGYSHVCEKYTHCTF